MTILYISPAYVINGSKFWSNTIHRIRGSDLISKCSAIMLRLILLHEQDLSHNENMIHNSKSIWTFFDFYTNIIMLLITYFYMARREYSLKSILFLIIFSIIAFETELFGIYQLHYHMKWVLSWKWYLNNKIRCIDNPKWNNKFWCFYHVWAARNPHY